jgi:hypothetical protein
VDAIDTQAKQLVDVILKRVRIKTEDYSLHQMDWPYYTWENGRLKDESGGDPFPDEPSRTANEWQEWMEMQDIRGTVQ